METPSRLQISARRSDFPRLLHWLARSCDGLPPAQRHRLELVLEELFCNSLDHGYGGECDQPIRVGLAVGRDECLLRYEDEAPAHDPFAGDEVPRELDAGAEARPVGGLGLWLVRAYAASRSYRRDAGRNVIELRIPLRAGVD